MCLLNVVPKVVTTSQQPGHKVVTTSKNAALTVISCLTVTDHVFIVLCIYDMCISVVSIPVGSYCSIVIGLTIGLKYCNWSQLL